MNDHLERLHTLIPQVDDTRIRNLAERFAQLSADAQASAHPVADFDAVIESPKQSRLYDDWRERTDGILAALTDVNVDLVKRAIGPALHRLYTVHPELPSGDIPAVRPGAPFDTAPGLAPAAPGSPPSNSAPAPESASYPAPAQRGDDSTS